ncbi:MAG: calcium-binding protein [Alphaproteobacteria bacterium HGW-Alphaproteobacteria-13]|nr:MAG: calcium-binding protein [Alphaproteobacteria bacterium HGW-Alphaproteobacteria-13]
MWKQMLFAGAAALSVPALAQEQPPADPTAPPPPAEDVTTPPPADDAAAQSGTAATPTQIAQIVDQEFSTYDADASGELDAAEFAAWMKKLRAATDPSVDTESEAVKSWIDQAFAAADTDKSGGVNKAELTAFLSRGA